MAISLDILAHAVLETAKISWPAVREARRGTITPAFCDEKLRSWAHRLLLRVHAQVVTEGADKIQPGQSYVIVSNHQSMYDIPALFVGLPLSLRMAAKAELFRTPLWGPAMQAAGFIKIDRKSPAKAYKALGAGGRKLRAENTSLFIAPEGTRSEDGSVREFKRGAFRIAQQMELPILPVALDGTRFIHEKGASKVRHGQTIKLKVLDPISPENFGDLAELRVSVRERIVEAIGQLNVQPGS